MKLLFLEILRRLTFTNAVLSDSGQKNYFQEFKVLSFKTVCIFFNKCFSGLTLTSPIRLDRMKMSFHLYKPLQKYSRTLTVVFSC